MNKRKILIILLLIVTLFSVTICLGLVNGRKKSGTDIEINKDRFAGVDKIEMMVYKNNTMDKATDTMDKETDAIDKAADAIEINVKGFKMQYIPQNRSLTVEDFQNIELGESIEEIEEKIGEPDGWIGCGILHPVYVLDDGRTVACYFSYSQICKDLKELIVYKGNDVDCVLKEK